MSWVCSSYFAGCGRKEVVRSQVLLKAAEQVEGSGTNEDLAIARALSVCFWWWRAREKAVTFGCGGISPQEDPGRILAE